MEVVWWLAELAVIKKSWVQFLQPQNYFKQNLLFKNLFRVRELRSRMEEKEP